MAVQPHKDLLHTAERRQKQCERRQKQCERRQKQCERRHILTCRLLISIVLVGKIKRRQYRYFYDF